MAIYLYNVLSIPIYAALIKNRKRLVLLISLQMFLILALRAETIGGDLLHYKDQFLAYQTYSFGKILSTTRFLVSHAIPWGHESGFVLLCWVLGRLGLGFHCLLVVCAALSVAGIGVLIYRYAEDIPLSFLCFIAMGCFTYYFGSLRQSAGFLFFVLALSALKEGKAMKFFANVALATLFHAVFIVTAALWFVRKIKLTRNVASMILGASLASVAVLPVLMNRVILPILRAVGGGAYEQDFSFTWNNMIIFILAFFILIVFLDRIGDRSLRSTESELYWTYTMAIPVQCLAFFVTDFARATIGMFLPVGGVLLGNILHRYPEHKTAFLIRLTTGTFFIVFYILTIYNDPRLVPYVSLFG